ncbi:cell wall-binding repeat-containing protein [Clostridium sp. CX1]|uniref:cell wall-binding repeat-containing protein n=1 Tax=Clostridium sp. CX1 TaxID=2978346 RepID=UPI0021C21726|nr:cell wall-binding repeat-containing protein [Clostridium sp. CX1]MCT8977240.1 cell wall-binding repeat-containing protein [Clostridium sp. CX1]
MKIKKMKYLKIIFFTLVICLSFQFFIEGNNTTVYASAGKNFYVSTQGNDKNNGSLSSPFKTIQRGLDELKPGDTLLIRGGVYHETTDVFNKSGSPTAWYTIKNYQNEEVTMTGDYKLNWGGKTAPDAITFRNSSFWKIQGIKMTKYTGAGIYVTDKSSYIEMSDLTIWDLDYPIYRPYGTSGIDGENSSFCSVKNSHIYNIGLKVDRPKDHGIYIGYGAYNWTFENNNIHDTAGAAIQLYGSPNGGSNCTIINNRLYNNHAYGLAIGSNATNNYVSNNMMYGNNWSDVYMLEASTNNWFKNNLFLTGYNNYNVQLTDESSVDNSFDYNTYYKNNGYVVNRYDQILNYEEWKSYSQESSGKYLDEPDEVEESIKNWAPLQVKQYSTKRLSGGDRFETAKRIAEEYNSGTVENVVITSGYSFTNALSGSVLAKKLNAPILLSGGMDEENTSAIEYIKAHLKEKGKIYILGNEGNANERIIIRLKALGYNDIKILQDGEKYGSVKAINDELNTNRGTPVIIASGNAFADGLSISAVAAAKGYPIILSDVDSLPLESEETIKNIRPSKIYIIGGTGAVSDNVKDRVRKLSGASEENVIRIWGENRYSTSVNIAKTFKLDGKVITMASGENFPDALAGSILAAKLNAPLILIGENNNEQKKFIDEGQCTEQIIFGGTASVSEYTQRNLAR